MDNWNEQLYEMIGRMRQAKGSKAAAVIETPCDIMVANKPNRNRSKASSVSSSGVNKAKIIAFHKQ